MCKTLEVENKSCNLFHNRVIYSYLFVAKTVGGKNQLLRKRGKNQGWKRKKKEKKGREKEKEGKKKEKVAKSQKKIGKFL